MPCERKMQQTRRLYMHDPLPLWTCQTIFGFQHFPGVDFYSHQGQLLPAGCWKELTETKTWIKHIPACNVNAKCNKFDASICTIHCHCEHVRPCWFSTFSWCRLLQPPGSAATSWMLKRVDRNENLNQTYLHAMWTQNATNSTPLYARSTATVNMSNHVGFQHFPGVDCYMPPGTAATSWMLKRVDRNENLNQTYTCMPCERKMQQTRRLYMHDPLPLWTCQTMLAFSIFLELTVTATRDSCYQLDVEKSWQKRKLESNIYLHAMWTQNATNSTSLYARSTATVNMSNHVGFQHFPGVDCYSHQGQLLPAGCWKELTETKTWIKHILACHVNAKCNKLDVSICTIHCHCEHVKSCWLSTFSWSRLLQPPGSAATSWILKRVDRNENLNQTYTCLHAMWMQNATNSTPIYARSTATVNMSNHVGFQHFPGVDCYSHQGQLLPPDLCRDLPPSIRRATASCCANGYRLPAIAHIEASICVNEARDGILL